MTGFLLRHRRIATECVHAGLAAVSLLVAFLLRFEFWLAPFETRIALLALAPLVAIKVSVFRAFALRDLPWRHVGFNDVLRIAAANLAASMTAAAALRWMFGPALPRSVYVLDLLLCAASMIAVRAASRFARERRQRSGARTSIRRILLYGAGSAGLRVLTELRAHPELGMEPVGFIDDDPDKRDLRLGGLKVLGEGLQLAAIARRQGVSEILIAIPAASGSRMSFILERCHEAGLAARKIPPLSEWIEARVLVDQVREVRLEDLLARAPVRIEQERIRRTLAGQVVLVTGAGGSIGSELCRQIARFAPRALIGFDHAETALYDIDQEIRERYPKVTFIPEIGSIQDETRLREVFARHAPFAVYHAAAYKHVPMMEHHPLEAVENNVFGTLNTARAAAASGAGIFVLVSSDKAVRPTNVMGATKRMAELVCLSAANAGKRPASTLMPQGVRRPTRYLAVRFGNVLGSNGSVIPLFRRQIAAGGPVTVTHPEMRRYFMTVPEAAQLVLESSAMGSGGEIFVLDMGEPLRIVDLARNLVLLSGLRPDQDIRIEYCGVRPGEKLFEELSSSSEKMLPTRHPKIRVYSGAGIPAEALEAVLDRLRQALAARDAAEVVACLTGAIPDYHPSGLLLRRAPREQAGSAVAAAG